VYIPKGVYRFWHVPRSGLAEMGDASDEGNSLSPKHISALASELDRLHAAGVTGFDVALGNLRVTELSDVVRLRNFNGVTLHSSRNTAFALARDRDRVRFNATYGQNVLTEKSAREVLAGVTSRANYEAPISEWYGAIDFGYGLTVGQIWSVDTGTGRWDYLNSKVMTPLVAGLRVLDLGSNNGVLPMMMLRIGAREVVGLEYSREHVEAAKVVHRLFEWRDLRSYRFTLHNWNMLAVLTENLGFFDVVSALCSLYYLPAQEMQSVVRRAAELAPTMVLQANIESPPSQAQEGQAGIRTSSVEFLHGLLARNGFPDVEVHAPAGFSRPLLVGRA
jgi:SAM-dependent methyltransferase